MTEESPSDEMTDTDLGAAPSVPSQDDPLLFELRNVQKHYHNFCALDGITFSIKEGSIGLLGPNGAGKSTLIKLLLGLLKLSGGSARVLGFELPHEGPQLRGRVGYMPENDCYLPYMTAVDYVRYAGELAGMPSKDAFRRSHEVLEYVGMMEARYRKLGEFSTGMKQRVKLAQALVHGPQLVFLDEPTNGLDPKGRTQMLDLLKDVKASGVRLVLSSHILPDIEEVCDHIVMLSGGTLLYEGSLKALYDSDKQKVVFDANTENDRYIKLLKQAGYTVNRENILPEVILRSYEQTDEILKIAVDHGIVLRHFMPAAVTLQAAFLQMLGEYEDKVHRAGEPNP